MNIASGHRMQEMRAWTSKSICWMQNRKFFLDASQSTGSSANLSVSLEICASNCRARKRRKNEEAPKRKFSLNNSVSRLKIIGQITKDLLQMFSRSSRNPTLSSSAPRRNCANTFGTGIATDWPQTGKRNRKIRKTGYWSWRVLCQLQLKPFISHSIAPICTSIPRKQAAS